MILNNGNEDYIKQSSGYNMGTRIAELYNISTKCPGNCMILDFYEISVLVVSMATYFRLKRPFSESNLHEEYIF